MHRFPLGRGRWIAAVAAIVILVGCMPPWYTVGGLVGGLPPYTGNAFEATGILVFLAALATLAFVALPYAASGPVSWDRWPPYLLLLLVGGAGLGIRAVDLGSRGMLGLPDRSPGLWIVGVGFILLARATYEIAASADRR